MAETLRVLLLGGDADADRCARRVAALTRVLETCDVAVAHSRAINPVLERCALVHLLPETPLDLAIRQAIHAHRWGRPLVVAAVEPVGAGDAGPRSRYEQALWRLIAAGAWRTIGAEDSEALATIVSAGTGDDVAAGEWLRTIYVEAMQEQAVAEQADPGSGQWLPALSPADYAKHLEDLVQLQLELIAHRDAEDAAQQRETRSQLESLVSEYERLGAWSRELEASHRVLQDHCARVEAWAHELETRVADTRPRGISRRLGALLRRR